MAGTFLFTFPEIEKVVGSIGFAHTRDNYKSMSGWAGASFHSCSWVVLVEVEGFCHPEGVS